MFDLCHPAPQVVDDSARLGGPTRALTDAHDVVEHVVDTVRIEGQDLGVAAQDVEGIGDLAGRHGAHPAQVLGEDEVGLDALDELGVEGVERLAVLDGFAYGAVDVGGRRPVVERQAAPRHDGLGASSRREVAPVGHPVEIVSEP